MISLPYAELVDRDRNIKGLKILLDKDELSKLLDPYFKKIELELLYIRYKPKTNCLINYRGKLDNKIYNLYAKAFRDKDNKINKFKDKFRNENSQESIIAIEDYEIIISFFPYDYKLPSIKYLGRPQHEQIMLRKIFPSYPEFWNGDIQVLHYKPERRLIAKLDTKTNKNIVLRFYNENDYAKLAKIDNIMQSNMQVKLPKQIGANNELKIMAFEWLDGEILLDIFRCDYNKSLKLSRDTGNALAQFHLQELPYFKMIKSEINDELFNLVNQLNVINPTLYRKAERIFKFISENLKSNSHVGLLHGDFHAKQIIVQEYDQMAFIDLDELRIGNPLIDIGNFISHLKYWSLYNQVPKSWISKIIASFISGYRKTKKIASDHEINLYTSIGLLRLIHHPFRICDNNWIEHTNQLLNLINREIKTEVY